MCAEIVKERPNKSLENVQVLENTKDKELKEQLEKQLGDGLMKILDEFEKEQKFGQYPYSEKRISGNELRIRLIDREMAKELANRLSLAGFKVEIKEKEIGVTLPENLEELKKHSQEFEEEIKRFEERDKETAETLRNIRRFVERLVEEGNISFPSLLRKLPYFRDKGPFSKNIEL